MTEYDMIEYKEVFRERREQKSILQDNEHKSYSLIMTMCTSTMQHRIESDSDFDSNIKDNPYSLLKAIKKKMFDPAKSKYSFAVFTKQLERLLAIRQEDGESLTEYVKRFKQHRDNMKELIGSTFLDKFIKNTEEYQVSDTAGKKKLKDEGFTSWTSFLLLKYSDGKKYGSLKKNLQTQLALKNDQYPKKLSEVTDVLQAHVWDPAYNENLKKKKKQREDAKEAAKEEEAKALAQKKEDVKS